MQKLPNSSFYDCQPWETAIPNLNFDLLNSLKQNLHSYEQGYRKFTIKSKCELPRIPIRSDTINSSRKFREY